MFSRPIPPAAGVYQLLIHNWSAFTPYKLTKAYQPLSQFLHDGFWSACTTAIASLIECWIWHAWGTGQLPYNAVAAQGLPWYKDTATILWCLTMPVSEAGRVEDLPRLVDTLVGRSFLLSPLSLSPCRPRACPLPFTQ